MYIPVGVFYYSIGNLPSYLRACLHSIQLVAIVKTKYIEKYGVDKILEPFVHDLKELEKVNIKQNYIQVHNYYVNTTICMCTHITYKITVPVRNKLHVIFWPCFFYIG